MDKSKTINFQSTDYFDDRLFVLYLCPSRVEIEDGKDGAVWTTIYHQNPPNDHLWSVVTYRNCGRYPLYRIDSFYNKEDAEAYMKTIEPETPLISLGGKTPDMPLSYDAYVEWKRENNLKDYDWQSLYSAGGTNAQERVGQTKEQFKGIR